MNKLFREQASHGADLLPRYLHHSSPPSTVGRYRRRVRVMVSWGLRLQTFEKPSAKIKGPEARTREAGVVTLTPG